MQIAKCKLLNANCKSANCSWPMRERQPWAGNRLNLRLVTDYRNSSAGSKLIIPHPPAPSPPQVSHSTNGTTRESQIAQSNSAETQAVFGHQIQSLTTSINLVAYGKRRKNYKRELGASPPPPRFWNSWYLGYIDASCWPLGVMVAPP